jgi:hypothetical protein
MSVRCAAHRQDGRPCGRWSIEGGNVCMVHGGAAPQVHGTLIVGSYAIADKARRHRTSKSAMLPCRASAQP